MATAGQEKSGGKPGVQGIQSPKETPEAGGVHHPQDPQAGLVPPGCPLPDS